MLLSCLWRTLCPTSHPPPALQCCRHGADTRALLSVLSALTASISDHLHVLTLHFIHQCATFYQSQFTQLQQLALLVANAETNSLSCSPQVMRS